MLSPRFLSFFGGSSLPTKATQTGLEPSGINYEATAIRWSEFVRGSRSNAGSKAYIDFDECENCGKDWDGEDWDDDALDWVEPPVLSEGRRLEGVEKRGIMKVSRHLMPPVLGERRPERAEIRGVVRVSRHLCRPEDFKGDVDIWRTRLGKE